MTLAHELCHLIFDADRLSPGASRPFLLFSPYRGEPQEPARRVRIRLPDELELVERRANAFAAHFMAPPEGVRGTVGELEVTSDAAINAVCNRFGVGRVVAINQLTKTYRLSREVRQEMLSRRPTGVLPEGHPDGAVSLAGLRAGRLEELVLRALAEGRIGPVRAREYLGLRLSEPLPAHPLLSEEQRAPVHSAEHTARLAAHRWLAAQREFASCYVAGIARVGERFRVDVEEMTEGKTRSRGHLILSQTFEVRSPGCAPSCGSDG